MSRKRCTRCWSLVSLERFSKNPKGRLGRSAWCNECKSSRKAERLREDPGLRAQKQAYERRNWHARPDRRARSLELKRQPHRRKKERERRKFLRDTNLNVRIKTILRHRLYSALRGKNKSARTLELLGCSIEFLREHLEAQFVAGMTWANYGKWHVDHIRPVASFDFTDPQQQRECFHWTNLQPLWASDNIKKSDKLPGSGRQGQHDAVGAGRVTPSAQQADGHGQLRPEDQSSQSSHSQVEVQ